MNFNDIYDYKNYFKGKANDTDDKDLITNYSKEEIVNLKNNKIKELENIISDLIKENEIVKDNYAQSVSFFKNYIDMLEEELKNKSMNENCVSPSMFITDVKDINDKVDIIDKGINNLNMKYGNFEKCEFCDEIIVSKLLKHHIDSLNDIKEIDYKLRTNDIDGIKDSIRHGYNVSLIIDRETNNSKNLFLYYI